MPKKRFTEDGWKNDPWFRALVGAMTSCKSEQDMTAFLRDIATLSELQAMSERLEVAKQLSRGLSYRQVSKQTGASTTTVTRVARFIESGEGGYRKFLKSRKSEIRDGSDAPASDDPIDFRGGVRKASDLRKYLSKR